MLVLVDALFSPHGKDISIQIDKMPPANTPFNLKNLIAIVTSHDDMLLLIWVGSEIRFHVFIQLPLYTSKVIVEFYLSLT